MMLTATGQTGQPSQFLGESLALQAKRPKRKARASGTASRPARRRMLSFQRLIKAVSDRYGVKTATAWTKAVLKYQNQLSESALRSALASGNLNAIEGVIGATKLQKAVQQAIQGPLLQASQVMGMESAKLLARNGLVGINFGATHPNVVMFAREQSAELVRAVPQQVKRIIGEVIAQGAAGHLTVADQARAIREVVGLPPNWARAPRALAEELRNGEISKATGRRMSAVTKQKIRSAARRGTITESFIKDVMADYSKSLVNLRATNIARTETQRSANHGLNESWKQAKSQGVLPPQTRRFWLVTPDERLSAEHALIPGMNPDGRRLDEPFDTPDGVVMYPPSRPNCRCGVGLAFTGTN